MATVKILNETLADWTVSEGWRLCFQWCKYNYDDESHHFGYRFIWRRPNGNLQPGRAQARIPSLAEIERLTSRAREEGWGHHTDGLVPTPTDQ